jgi:hypothetical protein
MKMIEELMAICDMETDDSMVGWRKRRNAMEKWVEKHINEVKTELSVLNPEVFNSEFMDFIKESLVKGLAEDLTTYTEYNISDKVIKAKLLILKETK